MGASRKSLSFKNESERCVVQEFKTYAATPNLEYAEQAPQDKDGKTA